MSITLSCEFCGAEFQRDSNGRRRARFCSKECSYAYRRAETDKRYVGRKFGRLTVLRRDENGNTAYLCRCECGNLTVVRADHLTDGETLSCGCYRRENGMVQAKRSGFFETIPMPPGSKFNRLTVIKRSGKKYGRPAYLCQCDCGNLIVVSGCRLRNGNVKSCGCLHREKSAERLRKIATKHGLAKHRWYINFLKHRRHELDKNWTPEMEQFLRGMQRQCVVCGAEDGLEIDHVLAFANGHGLEPGNACVLCRSCNSAKHARPLSELPGDWQFKIRKGAAEFKIAWKLYNTPSLATAYG